MRLPFKVGDRVQCGVPMSNEYDVGTVVTVYSCGDVRVRWDLAHATYDEGRDDVDHVDTDDEAETVEVNRGA